MTGNSWSNPNPSAGFRSVVVGLGELLFDCFGDTRRPGGAPANVAFHAQQLGLAGVVFSRVGRDQLGRELLDFLQRQGLETDYIQEDPSYPTGQVTVDTGQADHPRYTIHENVAWDYLAFEDRVLQLVAKASALCFGTLAQRSATSRRTIAAAIEAAPQSLIVYDINLRPPFYQRDWIESSLQRAHLAKLNQDEAQELATMLALSSTDLATVGRSLCERYQLHLACITRAAQGCLLMTPGDQADIPGLAIEVADTVGAGDAFTAALIFAYLARWPLALAGEFANRVGAMVAGRPGAMPHLGRELDDLKAEFTKQL